MVNKIFFLNKLVEIYIPEFLGNCPKAQFLILFRELSKIAKKSFCWFWLAEVTFVFISSNISTIFRIIKIDKDLKHAETGHQLFHTLDLMKRLEKMKLALHWVYSTSLAYAWDEKIRDKLTHTSTCLAYYVNNWATF